MGDKEERTGNKVTWQERERNKGKKSQEQGIKGYHNHQKIIITIRKGTRE